MSGLVIYDKYEGNITLSVTNYYKSHPKVVVKSYFVLFVKAATKRISPYYFKRISKGSYRVRYKVYFKSNTILYLSLNLINND